MPRSDDEGDFVVVRRSLQRKLTFWRRVVWSVLGIVVICVAVLWNRAANHRHNCSGALEHYARLAEVARLENESVQIIEEQWQNLTRQDKGKPHLFPPSHYLLIVENWGQKPGTGESLPLAVCNSPHLVLFSYGRHVLYRDVNGFHVKWLDEEGVQSLLAKAGDN